MPDPKEDTYNRYRTGLLKRHIACSGRYLSELWLKEFEPQTDPPHLARHSRTFTSPTIPSFVSFRVPILGSSTLRRPATVRLPPYFITLSQDAVTYNLPGIGSGTMTHDQTLTWGSYFIRFCPKQLSQTRTYVPWLSKERMIYGGGENPLARGGIAMATLAVEYMVRQDPTSLRFAEHLLHYFEQSEWKNGVGQKSGFFFRCDHISNVSGKMEMHASVDELVGMLLGLYYFYLATDHHNHRTRIRGLVRRLGAFLQGNAFVLLGPESPPTLHRGYAAPYLFQWAFQQAFQRICGDRFDPGGEDYNVTSERLYEVYVNRNGRMLPGADPQELLGIMYLWVRTGCLDAAQADRWMAAIRAAISDEIAESDVARWAFLGMFPDALGDVGSSAFLQLAGMLDLSGLASPLERYVLTIGVLQAMTFFWSTENWYNHAMTLHTIQYALDEEVIRANGDQESAVRVAAAANAMIKTVLCGERLPKMRVGGYTLGTPDDDVYAAVIAKGLLSRYVSLEALKCSPLPPETGPTAAMLQYPYLDRIRAAIEGRSRMWEDLPLGELWWVRNRSPGWELAPVRWHNEATEEAAKWGLDFCWERQASSRVLCWGKSKHDDASGLRVAEPWTCESDHDNSPCRPSATLKQKFEKGIDVVYEAGGLDFLFPRILMSHWLNEPVHFTDANARPLKGITCLPWRADGHYKQARCRPRACDWLLLSSAD